LLTWVVRPVKRGGKNLLGIICPQCEQRAIVSKKWLDVQPAEDALKLSHSRGDFEGRVFKTRPCTYCFKASYLPGEHPDDKA
jgi:hypothetical protein